jgi:hypothetical protein
VDKAETQEIKADDLTADLVGIEIMVADNGYGLVCGQKVSSTPKARGEIVIPARFERAGSFGRNDQAFVC